MSRVKICRVNEVLRRVSVDLAPTPGGAANGLWFPGENHSAKFSTSLMTGGWDEATLEDIGLEIRMPSGTLDYAKDREDARRMALAYLQENLSAEELGEMLMGLNLVAGVAALRSLRSKLTRPEKLCEPFSLFDVENSHA